SFLWRISREIEVGKTGENTWLPLADVVNLLSMTITAVGVFILPILDLADSSLTKYAFGLALLLFIGYPFALAGHYGLYNKNTPRGAGYMPFQEKIVLLLILLSVVAYLLFAFR